MGIPLNESKKGFWFQSVSVLGFLVRWLFGFSVSIVLVSCVLGFLVSKFQSFKVSKFRSVDDPVLITKCYFNLYGMY